MDHGDGNLPGKKMENLQQNPETIFCWVKCLDRFLHYLPENSPPEAYVAKRFLEVVPASSTSANAQDSGCYKPLADTTTKSVDTRANNSGSAEAIVGYDFTTGSHASLIGRSCQSCSFVVSL